MSRLLAVTAVALFLAVPAAAAPSGPVQLSAVSVSRTTLPFGAPGRKNDRQDQVWRLNDRHGRTVGRLYLACRWVARFQRYCNADVAMPLGQITMAGLSPTAFLFRYAVTGGTEFYRGAKGDALFVVTGARRMIMSVTLT
jgi:hypothetical protein